MKNFYISAWVLLAAAAFVTVLTGTFNPFAPLALSLVALVLVSSLVMQSVITQTRDFKTEQLRRKSTNLIVERRKL